MQNPHTIKVCGFLFFVEKYFIREYNYDCAVLMCGAYAGR